MRLDGPGFNRRKIGFVLTFLLCSNGLMAGTGESRRLIDGAVKARLLEALRRGLERDEAAALVGFPLGSLYTARRRDPVFALGWAWAMELAAIDSRGGELARKRPEGETFRIAPKPFRPLQRQRMRWVRFTEKRQQIFLDHFAGTADAEASADMAGVSYATVRSHYRRNPEFAAAWDEALRVALALLEADALRQRLEAQRRLKENLHPTGEMAQEFARGDIAAEFERVMKLLARWDRRDGRAGPRDRRPGRGRWTFDEAIVALDKRLRILGIRRGIVPPDGEAPA